MKQIIGYNDYLTLNDDFSLTDFEEQAFNLGYGELGDYTNEINYYDNEIKITNFFSAEFEIPYCDLCHSKLEVVFFVRTKRESIMGEGYLNRLYKIFECPNCGWWKFLDKSENGAELAGTSFSNVIYKGIIKKYDVSDKNIPISVLNKEIKKNPRILHSINTTRFEMLTRDVFSDFYNCDVVHCGKSHDGGKDLFMIISDEPILVQCKRRVKYETIEPISSIREFIGTLFIEEVNKGIYVTTAKDFSMSTKKLIKKQLDRRKLERFDLINFDEFIKMHNLTFSHEKKPWEKIFSPYATFHENRTIEIDKYNFYDKYGKSFY